MDSAIAHIQEVVVVHMPGAKAQARQAGIHIVEKVVVIGHMQVASILSPIAIGVTDQRNLIMVVEAIPRNRDVVSRVGNIEQTVVVILAVIEIGEERIV